MKKYIKEIIITLIQSIMFYLFPLTAGPTDAMGMVFILLMSTFILSLVIEKISERRIKYFYPIVVAIIFIPTVFIYYNSSALIHSIWYLTVSILGLTIGSIFNKLHKMN